ncbi:MAG: SDR family oxidoreductase [Acidobacteria bacterium]|nr:SDR family oxidoreductase [Acidobacteriota bacterium]
MSCTSSNMKLAGKVALITGAGSGIGQAIAELFAQEGADVALLDINGQGLNETAARIAPLGRRVLKLEIDLSDTAAARNAAMRAAEELGPIDILVNSAAIAIVKPFLEITEEEYDAVQRTNIRGLFFLSQAVARQMVERGKGGRIIHIGSTAGESPFPQASVYAVSKGGVKQLTRSMAIELAPHGINVNCIAPGHCDTPLSRKHITDESVRQHWLSWGGL